MNLKLEREGGSRSTSINSRELISQILSCPNQLPVAKTSVVGERATPNTRFPIPE